MARLLLLRAICAILFLLPAAGCATVPPAPPWEWPPYSEVAVLPARMVVGTGAPPFTSADTDRSNRLGGLVQQATAAALVGKGYSVLPPLDLNERLNGDRALGERFIALAASFGMVPDSSPPPDAVNRALEDSPVLARALGADLLVLVHGGGEYHSAGETIVQGVLRGVLTRGREGYQPPASFLNAEVIFIDPGAKAIAGRIETGGMGYSEDVNQLASTMLRRLRSVPDRPGTGSAPR